MRAVLAAVTIVAASIITPVVAETADPPKFRKGEKAVVEGVVFFSAAYAPFTRCLMRSKDTVLENARAVLKKDTADNSVRAMASIFAATETCKDEMNAAGRICTTKMSDTACAILGARLARELFN